MTDRREQEETKTSHATYGDKGGPMMDKQAKNVCQKVGFFFAFLAALFPPPMKILSHFELSDVCHLSRASLLPGDTSKRE